MNETDKKIVKMLRTGASNAAVQRELAVGLDRVARVRRELGIAPYHRGARTRYADVFQAIAAHVADEGEHQVWTGATTNGTPTISYRAPGQVSVARVLFAAYFGREPQGYVKPSCGRKHCVRPKHLADAVVRTGRAA